MIVTKKEFLKNIEEFKNKIMKGAIFVYPTDTIYGIGCNAMLDNSVDKIRNLKESFYNFFSVIAPSKDWIINNSDMDVNWLEKLPGPYTIIAKLKNSDCISRKINNSCGTLGMRIPNNWFSKIVEEINIPVVTTSVNIHSKNAIKSIDEIPQSIKDSVDFIIDEGVIDGSASTLINLTKNNPVIIKR